MIKYLLIYVASTMIAGTPVTKTVAHPDLFVSLDRCHASAEMVRKQRSKGFDIKGAYCVGVY
jgi:hypothetical protein